MLVLNHRTRSNKYEDQLGASPPIGCKIENTVLKPSTRLVRPSQSFSKGLRPASGCYSSSASAESRLQRSSTCMTSLKETEYSTLSSSAEADLRIFLNWTETYIKTLYWKSTPNFMTLRRTLPQFARPTPTAPNCGWLWPEKLGRLRWSTPVRSPSCFWRCGSPPNPSLCFNMSQPWDGDGWSGDSDLKRTSHEDFSDSVVCPVRLSSGILAMTTPAKDEKLKRFETTNHSCLSQKLFKTEQNQTRNLPWQQNVLLYQ